MNAQGSVFLFSRIMVFSALILNFSVFSLENSMSLVSSNPVLFLGTPIDDDPTPSPEVTDTPEPTREITNTPEPTREPTEPSEPTSTDSPEPTDKPEEENKPTPTTTSVAPIRPRPGGSGNLGLVISLGVFAFAGFLTVLLLGIKHRKRSDF